MVDPAAPALLDASPEEGARRLALRWIDDASQMADRVLEATADPEALHDLRVALRKLRTVLRTYKKSLRGAIPHRRRARLKELVATTGMARDAEVQLAWLDVQIPTLSVDERPGAYWLRERVVDRKDAAYVRLRSATVPALLDLLPKLQRDLGTYEIEHHVNEVTRALRFAEVTADLVVEQATALADVLRSIDSIDQEGRIHEARIHGKRLRYLLDPLRDDVEGAREVTKTLKGLQDRLGEINDVAVRTRSLREELETAALDRARRLALVAEREDAGRAAEGERDEQPGLLALVRITHHRRQELFDAVRHDWIEDRSAIDGLVTRVESLASTLRGAPPVEETAVVEHAAANDGLSREIERKYLLRALPDRAREVAPIEIDQGYLPGEQLHERLRRMRHGGTERWYRCVKLGKGISRIEIEEETSREIYVKLWPLTKGRRVRKRRYEITEGEHVFQIDEFVDRELFLCEVELRSEHERVELPDWLAPLVVREVTSEAAYVNLNLAR